MVFSTGSRTASLGEADIRKVVGEGLESFRLDGKSVLAVIPDHTPERAGAPVLPRDRRRPAPEAKQIDFLIALGTHPPMPEDKINELLKLTPAERRGRYAAVRMLNHDWTIPPT